jgi:hypothetical protein
MKVSTMVPKLLAVVLAGSILVGCAVDADDDDGGTVVTPGTNKVKVEDGPDVHVNPTPDVNIKTETTPSSNTTG